MKKTDAMKSVALLSLTFLAFLVAAPAFAAKGTTTKPVISAFKAAPNVVLAGQRTTLSWSVSGATSLSITPNVGVVFKTSKNVTPATTTLYTLTAVNNAGTSTATALVSVQFATSSATSTPTGEIFIQAYTTSYSVWDNTPAGSTAIAYPVLHSAAGGVGTYTDPITIAVGHSIINGKDILDYPPGTRFYIPNVRRYFIVEDSCGDGTNPQNGPCHIGYPAGTMTWLDMWIDGSSGSATSVSSCASFLTDTNGVAHLAVENPISNYVVVSGPIFANGSCSAQFGNTAVTI